MNGDWLLLGRDGRLSVYFQTDDAALWRAESTPGGGWEPPRRAGGDQELRPGALAVGQGADGYAHLAAWQPIGADRAGLVHTTHYRPLLAPLDWQPAGHPNKQGDRTGPPTVAVDAQGRAHVFVRNGGGGMSMVAQREKGGWAPWRDLKGSRVQESPVAVTTRTGLVELYAPVESGILHWRQEAAGTRMELGERLQAAVRPGSLRALATSAERTTVFFTDDDTGELCAWRPGGKPAPLVPAAGPGPVSAVGTVIDGADCTLLAQRAAGSGRVAFAAYPSEAEEAGAAWTESGPALPADATVALALDADGRLVAATLSPSTGQLLLTRRKDEAGLALGAWQAV
ncbi:MULTISPECIES: hypothetical protein [Streptomyces violaceoruber group]|uniref:PLL-like beta propeller domain-containing protein n=1 Tax=Streptomyces rubrogriseus TaxID=194673 RepID=A0ABT4P0G6_9ACTN|nr:MULTISPECIES: hypothetical protein [Streptomyces anthocyanicus group]MCW8118751.1 hypothetical protein [Streptomyces anthocyanicus]MCZ4634873.1 hypothetical protein [Streptomyces rubrogriseus]